MVELQNSPLQPRDTSLMKIDKQILVSPKDDVAILKIEIEKI